MKMSQVHADMERAQQFVAPLPLDEYRQRVGHHLDLIEAGAEMAARHVRALDRRPAFDARAREELDCTEMVLEQALAKIRVAKVAYEQKPMERSHAG